MLSTRTKIALAAIVHRIVITMRRLAGYGSKVEVTRSGVSWALDIDEGIDFSIWLLHAFERSTVAAYSRLVRPGMTVVDIGANIGAHTLPLARLVGPSGRVIAVEPTAWAVQRLRVNLSLNQALAAVVEVHQAMLVAKTQDRLEDEIYASWPLHGRNVHPKLRAQPKSTAGASALTLDELVRSERLAHVDFIKLDVDGYDGSVLRGGLNTLRRDRPTMILELSPYLLAEKGDRFDNLLGLLDACGYRLHDLKSQRVLPSDADTLAKAIPHLGSINVIAMAPG